MATYRKSRSSSSRTTSRRRSSSGYGSRRGSTKQRTRRSYSSRGSNTIKLVIEQPSVQSHIMPSGVMASNQNSRKSQF